ncbi:MAG: SUF system NifU family Fe-S cluster assembly protein [Dehalococcoidia bacterium]|nr:SUF system NifU family Fe-S cluster assembly protein [Dehalococcoidia bacterium]
MPNLPDVPLQGLYGDLILDHYRNPRHRTPVSHADVEAEEFNPFCGDRVILQFRLDGQGRIVEAGAQSEGCSIIQASASMLADIALGKSVAELERLSQLFRTMMRGEPSTGEAEDELGDLHSLQVVRQFPVRIKCALLPWTALEIGIEGFRSKNS